MSININPPPIPVSSASKCVVFKSNFYVIAKSSVYTSDAQAITWHKIHEIYPEEGLGAGLQLAVTIGNQGGDYNLVILGADRDIWTSDGKTWHDTKTVKKCSCDIKIILCKGCQCGGA